MNPIVEVKVENAASLTDEEQDLHDHFADVDHHDIVQHYCIYYSPNLRGWVGEEHDNFHCYIPESVDIADTKKEAIKRYDWAYDSDDVKVNIAKNKNAGAPC